MTVSPQLLRFVCAGVCLSLPGLGAIACQATAPSTEPAPTPTPSPEPDPTPDPTPDPGVPTDPPPTDQTPLLTIPDDAPTNESSCEERVQFAQDSMNALVEAANGSCSTDAECTFVFAETQCRGSCQAPILAANRSRFDEAKAAINAQACTDFAAGGCPFATPSCAASEARCEAGRCAMVVTPPPAQ